MEFLQWFAKISKKISSGIGFFGFRGRVEHVFGSMKMRSRGNVLLRSIGRVRAGVRLCFRCLVYNMDRFAMFCAKKEREMERGGGIMA